MIISLFTSTFALLRGSFGSSPPIYQTGLSGWAALWESVWGLPLPSGLYSPPPTAPTPRPVGWFVSFESLLCPLTSDPMPGGRVESWCSLCCVTSPQPLSFQKPRQQQAVSCRTASEGLPWNLLLAQPCLTRKTPGLDPASWQGRALYG